MPDEVNFVSDDRKKKSQSRDLDIEYSNVLNQEKHITAPSLQPILKATAPVRMSFLEWRTERKKKREEIKRQAEEEKKNSQLEHAKRQAEANERQQLEQRHRDERARIAASERVSQHSVQHNQQAQQEVVGKHIESVEQMPVEIPKTRISAKQNTTQTTTAAIMPQVKNISRAQEHVVETLAAEMPSEEMASVNLVSEVLLQQLRSQNRLRDLVVVFGLMCVFLMTIYSGFNMYAQKLHTDTHDVVAQIQVLDEKIAAQENNRIRAETQNKQLQAVQDILNAHIEWSPFFSYIEEWTLPTVSYTSIIGSATTGEFTLSALTTDLRYMTAQVETLRRSPYVLSASTTSASQTVSGTNTNTTSNLVQFTLTIHFDVQIFYSSTNQDVSS